MVLVRYFVTFRQACCRFAQRGSISILVIAGAVLFECSRDRNATPLLHEAYVWQRSWDDDVRGAVSEAGASLSGILCLAAEVTVDGNEIMTRRIPVDHGTLRKTGRPITAVVRIFPSVAENGWNEQANDACEKTLREIVSGWSREHPGGIGLQIDFDCPDRHLFEFHQRLRRWKSLFPAVSFTITALPSWLGRKEFPSLAAEFPDYVLQVHSLHLPVNPGEWVGICDPAEMRAATNAAGKLGVPFRLALPTYSCLVVFDDGGGIAEVYGEDLPESLPVAALKTMAMDSDAHLLSQMVRNWDRARPGSMNGVIWYRLPTPGDRLNWDWPVLERIISGIPLSRGWSLHMEADPAGYHRVILRQDGSAPDDLPGVLRIRVPGGRVIGCDGLSGYVSHLPSGDGGSANEPTVFEWRLADPTRHFQKPAGWSGVIGWCRWEGNSGPPETEIPKS